jgi:arabinofuranan 3-O-arabinosyltransferase
VTAPSPVVFAAPQDGADPSPPSPDAHRAREGQPAHRWTYAVLAVLAYVPMLLTKPGVVSDDTKTYLYLDPGRWTRNATSIWDPNVALGTVTHENIGYLFPTGPYYWLLSLAHVPVWVAQRFWLGTIIFVAGAGVLLLAKALDFEGPRGAGAFTAAAAYAFTPYVMQYAGRISVILLPYAGLPVLLYLVVRSVRAPGWRYPALVAFTVACISGINASSVIYVGLAPVLWLPYSVFVAGEATGRQAWGTLLRAGILSLLVSLWWIVGLAVEGAFGINVLRYTESVQATSSTSNPAEVLRGLGYWYFYGGDRLGLWTQAAAELTQRLLLVAVTYVLPVAAFVAAVICRWRYRAYFVGLVALGVILSVGAYPYKHPTAFGGLVKTFMTRTTVGLALRSTDRATPLVVLGLAVLLGMGVSALIARLPRMGLAAAALLIVLVLAADAPSFAGRAVVAKFVQPAGIPSSVRQAADYLNSVHPGTRVYALPGDNFAAYRWGDTIDPVWPAVLNRPFVTREQQIQGSLPTADLLYALDAPLQEGTMNWNALAPVARLMSAGDVLVQYDQANERYAPPRPALVQHDLATTPPGLGPPVSFGPPTVNRSTVPMLDETYFGLPPATNGPSPIVTYAVPKTRAIVRGESVAHPLVVDGDGVGLVQSANVGLLAADPTIFYAGTLDRNPKLAGSVLHGPVDLVVTDSNRKQAFEWNSLNDNTGYTETATEPPSPFVQNDPQLNLFLGTGAAAQTTTVLKGVSSVTASAYGTAFTLRSEWRPANALDGKLATAWATEGDSGVPVTDWWQMTLRAPTTANSVNLVQPIPVANETDYTNQWITKATLTFDDKQPVTVDLGPTSRTAAGQTIEFAPRSFRTLRITIDATNLSTGSSTPPGSSLVGLAEVRLGHVQATQIVKMPDDLLRLAGTTLGQDRLTYILTRQRVAPVPPRSDPEVAMIRQFAVPAARSFTLSGTARISSAVADNVVDQSVGRNLTTSGVVRATSSSRMPGDLAATASATLDGDPSTAWSPGLGTPAQVNSWLDYQFAHPVTVDHLGLGVVSDAEHSRPTSVTISTSEGSRTVALPPIPVTAGAGSTTAVPVTFPSLSGTDLRVTFSGVDERTTPSYETSLQTALPIAITDVAIPGVRPSTLPATIPSVCRSDLLSLDGRPLWVTLSGTPQAALDGNGLSLAMCGPDLQGVKMVAGQHLLTATDGATTGLTIDQTVLDSAPGGADEQGAGAGALMPTPPASAGVPTVTERSTTATSAVAHVSGATVPFALVLGQSINRGWTATISGGSSLGAPVLIDGFANGWIIDKQTLARAGHHGSFDVTLYFAPQSMVNLALLISGLALLACVAIVGIGWLWHRRRKVTGNDDDKAGSMPSASMIALRLPFIGPDEERSTHFAHIAVGTVVAGLAAWALGGPFAGIVVTTGVLVAMIYRRGRSILLASSALLMLAAALDVVVHQERYRYPSGGWPTHFDRASTLAWAAVLLLAAEAGLEVVRRFRARSGPADRDGPSS